MDHGYNGRMFFTPSIDGWVLVLGVELYEIEDVHTRKILLELSEKFGEAHLYGTNRITEYHFFGCAQKGKIKRFFSFLAESGECIEQGMPTEIEKSLHSISTEENGNKEFPTEETVMQVAEVWSINPTKIETYKGVKEIGYING